MIVELFRLSYELDITELKLNENWDVVDKFVIIEHPFDFQHRSKKMYYAENKERFKKYQDKIIHLIDDGPFNKSIIGLNLLWEVAYSPKLKATLDSFCDDNTFIIPSDGDVVIKRETFNKIDITKQVHYSMNFYERYFNRLAMEKFAWIWGSPYKTIKKYGIANCTWWSHGGRSPLTNTLRPDDFGEIQEIIDAGYHFCKCGDIDDIIWHIKGHPHIELANNSEVWTKEKLQHRFDMNKKWDDLSPDNQPGKWTYTIIPYDSKDYPKYLNEHSEIYSKYFIGGMK